MSERARREPTEAGGELVRAAAIMLLAGAVLGATYNWIGLRSRPSWGLSWIASDRLAELQSGETVVASGAASESQGYTTDISDPLAIPGGSQAGVKGLPEIPAVGRPVQIEIGAVKEFVDMAGAVMVDARESWEYEEGHIPGAISLPYDVAISDPGLLETLDTGGKPIITYCGGGACELSLSLAHDLLFAGHERVAVYMGGFPEWVEAGYAVKTPAGGS